MPINLYKIDALLKESVGKEYKTFIAKIDYEKEHRRILNERKKEFDGLPENIKSKYSMSTFNLKNRLETNQTYLINFNEAIIETDIFSLPASADTLVRGVDVYSSAAIKCGCWKDVREEIAKENGLEIIKKPDGEFFSKRIKVLKELMENIFYARKAEITLSNAQEQDKRHRLALGRVPEESLKPAQ